MERLLAYGGSDVTTNEDNDPIHSKVTDTIISWSHQSLVFSLHFRSKWLSAVYDAPVRNISECLCLSSEALHLMIGVHCLVPQHLAHLSNVYHDFLVLPAQVLCEEEDAPPLYTLLPLKPDKSPNFLKLLVTWP